MVSLKFSFDAVAPMLLLVLVGFFLQRGGSYSKEFCAKLNTLNFKVFLPAMLYNGIYGIESIRDVNWPAIFTCVFGILLLFGIGYIVQRATPDPSQKGVMWQCIFRSNFAMIGLPLSQMLGGDKALAFAATISAFVQLSFNFLGVFALASSTTESTGSRIKKVFEKVIRNPLVIASVLGIITLLIRELIPTAETGRVFSVKNDIPFVYQALGNLAKVASPLALVTLGAQFSFPRVKTEVVPLAVGTVIRLIIAPILGVALALLATKLGIAEFGLNEYPGVIALFGTPVGVSSVVLVQSMGGDADLANRLVVFTSALSIITLIVFIAIMNSVGLV